MSWAGGVWRSTSTTACEFEHHTADGHMELFTRRQERVSNQFPDVVELLEAGLGPREAILEGEIVPMTLRLPSCAPSRK